MFFIKNILIMLLFEGGKKNEVSLSPDVQKINSSCQEIMRKQEYKINK